VSIFMVCRFAGMPMMAFSTAKARAGGMGGGKD